MVELKKLSSKELAVWLLDYIRRAEQLEYLITESMKESNEEKQN